MAYDVRRIIGRVLLREGTEVASAVPGEAPAQLPTQPVLTEPDNAGEKPSLYDIYPDLAQMDVTSPCVLADFFAQLCEEEQKNAQMEKQAAVVPSMKDQDTPDEF